MIKHFMKEFRQDVPKVPVVKPLQLDSAYSSNTEPSSIYDNNHYHEECLRCNTCGINLTGINQKRARRFKNQIFCDLHFADVALLESSDFMQQLRSFKPQSLGCAVARRKSSTTLIFPLPPQACSDEVCDQYPHKLIPTPGYWIECSRPHDRDDGSWKSGHGSLREEEESPDGGTPCSMPSGHPSQGSDGSPVSELPNRHSIQVGSDSPIVKDAPNTHKTPIQEQYEKLGTFELTSIEQEVYEKYFYGTEHWNYFSNDEDLGPVILSLKQETINNRDQFRIMVRAVSYTVHGLVPASCVMADRYNREEVVRSLGKEVNLHPPLFLGQLPNTPEELLKLDQVCPIALLSPFEEITWVFMKSELKVGVVYVKEGQYTEEEILDNNEHSPLFEEFLSVTGEKVRLKGFDKYKGGLDTVHDLTGTHSVYTHWRGIEIMFHVSTLLPYEQHDPQKVSVVSRDEVGAYKPYLLHQSIFSKGPMFREWLLTKIVNGERASYSAPKFARMQERTRSQMLEDIVQNLQNHAETGQMPKPYRRGSWRPIGHMRPSSPLLDSVRDLFEGHDQLAKDFVKFFLNEESPTGEKQLHLFDVTFLVGSGKEKTKLYGVRALLGVRSRVFQEMLYGFSTGFGSPQVSVADLLARPAPALHSPSASSSKPSKSSNFLQVPDIEATSRPKSVPNSPMVIRAFSRLGNLTSGWGRSKKQENTLHVDDKKKWASSTDCSKDVDRGDMTGKKGEKGVPELSVPRLSVCADAQKVDKSKLTQTENPMEDYIFPDQFPIIEFEADAFRLLLNYLHTGSCPLKCTNIPGLICAAEHFDLPELLQACFHHAKQFLRVEVIFNHPDFLQLSESMVQMIMCRNLEVPEVKKFEAMLAWAKHRVRSKSQSGFSSSTKTDSRVEFRSIMERLTRDLKLYRISPHELIKVVLPSKAIKNERILETLMYQANSGMYRIQDDYLQACTLRLQKQDSRFSEWDSFDYGF
ncbi:unnamed protein product [Darwinula stevensoni]|uniref:Rap-GAP domain-containing protein n=1 Tax=Darwinula stevensoni TaxID=69355 RepID=A0A7R8X5G3_9CRUS|nr:unnamed protein product [Darwinula stevensoni]CAG0886584.1 unnamed protein product [Darwinula stevensoni]